MSRHNPFTNPAPRTPTDGPYFREEVSLANRNHGIALEMLRHDVTPAGLHYLLIHFDIPYIPSEAEWRLDIGGEVERAVTLNMAQIKALPSKTLRVTLECAGNGRGLFPMRMPSMPWMSEAVGTAEWTGTPLKNVLDMAGLKPGTVDIAFESIDRGSDRGNEHVYGRSLKPDLALSEDVMLVWAMNSQPLLPQHGFPLRLVVPGWYGMASVKWLRTITALPKPYTGHQQVGTYHFKKTAEEKGTPITHIRVKSLMVPPGIPDWYTRQRLVDRGRVEIFGRAWSGGAVPIAKVEVAVDGRWQVAALDPPAGKFAWRGWRFDWNAEPGEHTLMCRATDANGKVQPMEADYDRGGFGNNAVQQVLVTVR
jgi:DMSO/TMAO reductase YedYZ molybdopterin-dependent catalytic subunit